MSKLANIPPFEIELLFLSKNDVAGVPRIEVMDIFDGVSRNFHSKGLFSAENFGKVGEVKRLRLFGHMELNTEIFHPVIFKILCDLKALYSDIMNSKSYAIFDDKLGDFVLSDPVSGQTGYAFFIKHFEKLKFDGRDSAKREELIKNMEQANGRVFIDKLLVMPAGMRDYTVDENGKPSEDDINGLYRRVLGPANVLAGINKTANVEHLDSIRMSIQSAVYNIYLYLMEMVDGKNKFMLGKFAGRKIYFSTRNVITAYVPRHTLLKSQRRMSTNSTAVGLFQFLAAIQPLAAKLVKDGYMSDVFTGPNSPAYAVDPVTLKRVPVHDIEDDYDRWMTVQGFESVLKKYSKEELRHNPILIKDKYFAGLVYKGPEGGVKVFGDIDELPQGFDRSYVKPLTYTELLYMSVKKESTNLPCTCTRYPVAGYGSLYVSNIYLITTNLSKAKKVYDANWVLTDEVLPEFPIVESSFFNSVCPSPTHIQRQGADYDGDTVNFIVLYTDEAREEIKSLLNSSNYYVAPDGRMAFSAFDDISKLVVQNMFRKPIR